MKLLRSHFIICFLLITGLTTEFLNAQDRYVGFAFGAYSQGDDILQPSIGLEFTQKAYHFGLHYFGRGFGPVIERTYLLQIRKGRNLSLWFNSVEFLYGLSILSQQTTIAYSDPVDQPMDRSQTEYNLGMILGFRLPLFQRNNLSFDFAIESSIYPAGSAALFLATGRHQATFFLLNWDLP